MLTSELSIVAYDAGKAIPDRLTRRTHRHYARYAERMLSVYRTGIGRQRRELHRTIESIFAEEPDCPIARTRSFCKLLDDGSVYETDSGGEAGRLRLAVFSAAAGSHPLVERPDGLFENSREEVICRIAHEIGAPWDQIEKKLYADVMSFQRLESFEGYAGGAALLSRYNVAQLQACLYRAESVVVEATKDFKIILRYAKLARLIHEIRRVGPGAYRMIFSGPASVTRRTRRYGVAFARFLPALLSCRGWSMSAAVRTRWNTPARLELSSRDGYTGHPPLPGEFDSRIEESFAGKFGRERDGWRLHREGAVLHDRQAVFVPDFAFRHEDGTEVLMEIVGFWTPEYLSKRRETLRRFGRRSILIAVPERSLRKGARPGGNTVVYKTALKVKPVMEALERFRRRADGGEVA